MKGEVDSCLGATDCEVSPSPPGKTGKEGCVLWVQRQSCLLVPGVRFGETPFECEGVCSGCQQFLWRGARDENRRKDLARSGVGEACGGEGLGGAGDWLRGRVGRGWWDGAGDG